MTQHPKCVLNQHHHLTAQSIAWRLFSGTSHQQDGDNWGYSSKNSSGYSTKATNAQMIPFSWWLIFMASEKKSENHHINGAVAPRAVEREVLMMQGMSVMCHIKLSCDHCLCFRVGHLLRQNVARTALVSKGLWANWRDSWSLKSKVRVTSGVPKILLQPSSNW